MSLVPYDPQKTYRYFVYKLASAEYTVKISSVVGFTHYIFSIDRNMLIVEPGTDIPRPLDPATLKTVSQAYGDDIAPLLSNTDFTKKNDLLELIKYQQILDKAPIRTGPYSLLSKLGSGGFGVVFLAIKTDYSKMYAIKFMTNNTSITALINQEASILQHVQTNKGCLPYICYVEHALSRANMWIFITEYVSGVDLDHFVRIPSYTASVTEEGIIDLMILLVTNVAQLHSLSPPIYHRDLKEANIMIFPQPTGYGLRIIDFGISTVGVITDYSGTRGYKPPNPEYKKIMREGKYYLIDLYAIGTILQNLFNSIPVERRSQEFTNLVNRVVNTAKTADISQRYGSVSEIVTLLQVYKAGKTSGMYDSSIIPYIS